MGSDALPGDAFPPFNDALGALRENLCPNLQRIFAMYFSCLAKIMTELSGPETAAASRQALEQLKRQQDILIGNLGKNLLLIEEMWRLSEANWREQMRQSIARCDVVVDDQSPSATAACRRSDAAWS